MNVTMGWGRVLLASLLVSVSFPGIGQDPAGDVGVYPPNGATLDDALDQARNAADRRDYETAVERFQQAAELASGESFAAQATIRYELGNAYRRLNRHELALVTYAEGLSILGAADTRLASRLFNAQGISYRRLGRYDEAIANLREAVALREGLDDPLALAKAQANLGGVYQLQGRYGRALSTYREALTSAESADDAPLALRVGLRTDIGLVLSELGEFDGALETYQQGLELLEEAPNPALEARLLHNMAFAYFRRGEVERSIEAYGRALVLRRQTGDRRGEAKTLNNLGFAQAKQGLNEVALKNLRAAVDVARELGDRATEGRTLDSIATVYQQRGQYREALIAFHHALLLKRSVGDLGGEHVTLANIGRVHLAQDRPSMAILFLKQAVNVTERIRSDLATLPRETRQAYTGVVARTYHRLADTLIEQGRLPEAQQVLAMLKEEEYREFIRRDAGADTGQTRADYSPIEQAKLTDLAEASAPVNALGLELRELLRIAPGERTEEEKARIAELDDRLDRAQRRFADTLEEIMDAFAEIERSDRRAELAIKQLDNDLRGLVGDLTEQTGQQVGLIHYVVLNERLHVMFTSAELRLAREIAVDAARLNREIQDLRTALQRPSDNPMSAARQLHDRLIAPLETEIAGAHIEHLMVYLDGALRYVPLAALHDGERYLIERFSLSVYTAAAERNIKDEPQTEWTVAGLGLADARSGFDPLEAVPVELEGIVKRGEADPDGVLQGVIHLNEGFTQQMFSDSLRDGYPVLHVASHFVFRPGTEEDSFLLLGDGTELNLGELRRGNFRFGRVDLLTLSACETAVGGKGAEGQEVEGLATLTQKKGAKGVLATLWPVADESTGIFMQHFYRLRAGEALTKAEALRRTQVALLSGELSGGTGPDRGVAVPPPAGDATEVQAGPDYRHPYYWAPFILMGNWL